MSYYHVALMHLKPRTVSREEVTVSAASKGRSYDEALKLAMRLFGDNNSLNWSVLDSYPVKFVQSVLPGFDDLSLKRLGNELPAAA